MLEIGSPIDFQFTVARTSQSPFPLAEIVKRQFMNSKEIVKYFYEQIFSNNLLNEIEDYVDAQCKLRVGRETFPLGLDGMKKHIEEIRTTYPDFRINVYNQHSENEYVISEIIAEGTHNGEFLGIKPTGKKLDFTGIDIDKVKNGKIIEHRGAINTFETFIKENIITI